MSPFLLICRDCEFGSNDQTAIEKPSQLKEPGEATRGQAAKSRRDISTFFFILKPMSTTYMDLIRGGTINHNYRHSFMCWGISPQVRFLFG